jgi:serine/threonine-protein kinase HipA
VTTNVLIGNGDAHAKNFSLLHQPSGALTLTPLYDLMCTLTYGDDRLALYIDNVRRTNKVTAQRIANEAVRWGLSRDRAVTIISDLLQEAPAAIAAARDETEGVPDELVSVVTGQLARLQAAD